MNLRATRRNEDHKSDHAADPKQRHLFQEAVPGGPCAVCTRGKSDPIHQGVEVDESPRWGF